MTVSMAACGSSGEQESSSLAAENTGDTYKVAIVKQMDHASLDEIADDVLHNAPPNTRLLPEGSQTGPDDCLQKQKPSCPPKGPLGL